MGDWALPFEALAKKGDWALPFEASAKKGDDELSAMGSTLHLPSPDRRGKPPEADPVKASNFFSNFRSLRGLEANGRRRT
jgi:hypothetical protein